MQQTIQNAQLNILERGKGNPSLVFLHYFAGSSESWSELIIQLQKTNHCIVPDLPGFGDSQPIKEPTVEAVAKIIAELIHKLDLQNYILIGHSMGGKVALAFAANQPSGLRSLILLAPSPPTPEPIKSSERSRLLKTHGDRSAAEETAHKITVQTLSDVAFDRVVQDNLRTSQTAWNAWLEVGSRQDISSVMSRITVPVLLIVGADDPVIPKSLLEQDVISSIADAQLVVVPNAGHLLPIETPQAIGDLIQSHISQH